MHCGAHPAFIYTALSAAGYWQTIASVLMTGGAFYAFVLQRFEGSSTPTTATPSFLDLES
jgi:hypothetical protein